MVEQKPGEIIVVINGAENPELAEVCATSIAQHREVQQTFADALATKTPMREGFPAADTTVALLSPETYLLLTDHLGWSHEQWCAWAADCLIRTLIL